MQIKQKFSQVANEDGFITLNEFEALLRRLPATQENPELIELYKKVCSSSPSLFPSSTQSDATRFLIRMGIKPLSLLMWLRHSP